jgi:hypothetical protein
MDIASIKITQKDIDRVLAESKPGKATAFTGDVCSVYKDIRPILIVAQGVTSFVFPPASTAIAAAVAIIDKLCPDVQ